MWKQTRDPACVYDIINGASGGRFGRISGRLAGSQMGFYTGVLRPLIFRCDPEIAHSMTHAVAERLAPFARRLSWHLRYDAENLTTELCGVRIANPVGLAAGFDKNGKLVEIIGHVGFGFAEVGSITARASAGNPRPRLFRLPADEALVNRMGLNGDGAEVIAQRLARSRFSLPIAVNIAKTNDPSVTGDAAIADILYSFRAVKDLPLAFVTINASCPNTEEGRIEETKELETIFAEIGKENTRAIPILVKVSPDSSQQLIDDIVESAIRFRLAGYVCGNTTLSRQGLKTSAPEIDRIGTGGLSGPPLKRLNLKLTRRVYHLKSREQVIIGVGGVRSGQDAYDYIRSGASAIELYTGLIYEGPALPLKINRELSDLLKRDGLTLPRAVGIDATPFTAI